MGIESEEGLSPSDFGKIMDGHIEDSANVSLKILDNSKLILTQLSQSGLMVPGSPGYNPRPTEADRMHCVAFVISADTLSAMDETIEEKFADVLKEARARRKTDIWYLKIVHIKENVNFNLLLFSLSSIVAKSVFASENRFFKAEFSQY